MKSIYDQLCFDDKNSDGLQKSFFTKIVQTQCIMVYIHRSSEHQFKDFSGALDFGTVDLNNIINRTM